MADNKNKSTFFSTKQSTNDNKSNQDITAQIKAGIDMSVLSLLNGMAKDLNAIMTKVTGEKSSSKKESAKPTKQKEAEDKSKKTITNDEIKKQRKIAKEKEKSQNKVNKKIEKAQKKQENSGNSFKGLNSIFANLSKSIKNSFSDSFKEAMDLNNGTASKVLSSNSMVVNKSLRDLQIGMGLSSNQAMSLSGAMSKMNISKEDLAYLTQGQRDLLSDLTGTLESAYASTDMSAISEMGNSLFKIRALFGVLTDVVALKLQEVMTVLQPVLDMVIVMLGQVIDSVMIIFNSPEFKSIVALLGQIIASIVSQLMPVLQFALGAVVQIIFNLLTLLTPLITQLMPIVMMFVNVVVSLLVQLMPVIAIAISIVLEIVQQLLVPLMPIITMALQFIMELFKILVPIILQLLPIIVIVLQTIGMIMEMIMPILVPIIEGIGAILKAILPIIYTIIASVYNAIIMLYNFFVSAKNEKDKMDTSINFDASSSFTMPSIETSIEIPAFEMPVIENTFEMSSNGNPIANSYAGNNNVDSISNETKNITVDANFNSNISGEASAYSKEIQKSNFSSASLLASIIGEGV